MSGGTYFGNAAGYGKSMRFINFVSVTNSSFHDMHITEATDDNFTLGPGSRFNECRNLVGSFAGGNALTDKGDYNKWYDCIAEDCESDGWTPKCRNSEFYRCIGRRNKGPGFGCFARLDGSGNPEDLGETIEGNQFFACESYDNQRGGFSFNIASTSGKGAIIRNNYIQGLFYNNRMQGVGFRNKQADGIIDSNEVDILVYGNKGLKNDGTLSSYAGGLGVEGEVNGMSGSVVAFENGGYDVNINNATNCSISVYNPENSDPAVLRILNNSSILEQMAFGCSKPPDVYCVQAYCSLLATNILHQESIPVKRLSQNYPNPFRSKMTICYTVLFKSRVAIKLYDFSGREFSTLLDETKDSGQYTLTVDGSQLPGGTYFYHLVAGDRSETRKFVIIR